MTANASSQLAGASSPSRRTSGVRRRSGSSCNGRRLAPFGQMKPWEKTSWRSPRIEVTRCPPLRSTSNSSPQVASHSGQVAYAVVCALTASSLRPCLDAGRPAAKVAGVTLPLDLVLVRHGESEGNEAVSRARAGDASMLDEVRTRHSSFWQLTARGREQAAHSGRWLRDEFPQGFDLHHSSEYVRAMQTAALLDLPGAEWLLHPDLRERSWGDLDRLTPEERREHFAASLQEKASAPFYWRPPNGESIAEVSA